jgi:polo-like kinase 1
MNGTFASKKEVWITKWIDYSSKYGLGYILNNGYFGVYFNDNTKMLLNPKDQRFIYVERKITDKQESMFQFFLKDFPDILNNKVKLFVQFKKFLEEEDNNAKIKEKVKNNINESPSKRKQKEKSDLQKSKSKENIGNDFSNVEVKESDFIFVKKWMKTRHAIIFRFSNKLIQTIFKDKTQLLIHAFNNCVTYINKHEEKFLFELDKVFECNNYEVVRRVKYVKEILAHMASLNKRKKENEDDINDKSKSNNESTKKPEKEITPK